MESKCEPRQPKQAPKKGKLPLPGNVSKDILDYQPSKVEDLNELLPSDAPRLATTKPHPKVCLLRLFHIGVWEAVNLESQG